MGGVIRYAAKRWPDRTAIYWKDKKITFKELDELSDAFAKGVVARGIQKGDRVGLWMHNHPEWVVAWFGISKAGAVIVPLDYWYRPGEAEYILHHSGARALVISEAMLNVDFPAMVEETRARLRGLQVAVILGNADREWLTSWEDMVEDGSNISDEEMNEIAKEIGEHDMEFILYTSGTTGRPKGVVLSHYNMIRNAWDVGSQLDATEEDNILVPIPYSHSFGNTLVLTLSVLRGAAQTPMLDYKPNQALEMIDKYGVTIHPGVPTMFIRELQEFRKGYCVMRYGYFKQPEETKKTVMDGWLHTGDLGKVDEFGYYYITGRAKVKKFKLKEQVNAMIEAGEITKIVPTKVKEKR